MYRALTLVACERGVDPEDADSLAELMGTLTFSLDEGAPPELSIDGAEPRAELTGAMVEAHVSRVARHAKVRALMRAVQRRLGAEHGAVMEGRDIGSVVFADAPVKLYLEADPQARAERRAQERPEGSGTKTSLHDRDRRDMAVTPFEPSEGAVVIDTTHLEIAQALEEALAVVHRLAPDLLAAPHP